MSFPPPFPRSVGGIGGGGGEVGGAGETTPPGSVRGFALFFISGVRVFERFTTASPGIGCVSTCEDGVRAETGFVSNRHLLIKGDDHRRLPWLVLMFLLL